MHELLVHELKNGRNGRKTLTVEELAESSRLSMLLDISGGPFVKILDSRHGSEHLDTVVLSSTVEVLEPNFGAETLCVGLVELSR